MMHDIQWSHYWPMLICLLAILIVFLFSEKE